MSMTFEKREAACLEFIRSGFKQDSTIKWMMQHYADDPNITRARYPEKLCRNIITLGGNGDQQQLNIVAFHNAFNTFKEELVQRQEATWETKYKTLERDLERMSDRSDDAEARATKYGEEVRDLQNRLNNLEREKFTLQLQLQPGVSAEPTTHEAVAA